MSYEQIVYEVQDGVATLTLNRPDRLNAWTPVMEREVREAMTVATADEAVRVISLFSLGRDAGFVPAPTCRGSTRPARASPRT